MGATAAAQGNKYQLTTQTDPSQASSGSRRCCNRCCCIVLGMCLLAVFVPAWLYGNRLAKNTLQVVGSHVTGCPVAVDSTMIMVWHAQASVSNLTVYNPPNFHTTTPYFLNCKSAYADMDIWSMVSSLTGLAVIDELTVMGLSIYYDNENFQSNLDIVLKNIANNPVVKFAGQHRNENQRFIIKKVKVEDTQLHTVIGGVVMPVVSVPPMKVGNIGVKQNGVVMETLVGMLIEAFALEAVQHQTGQIAKGFVTTTSAVQ